MLNLQNQEFMSIEQIRSKAPSIFTATPAENVSDHYVHIPTNRVIEDMNLLGWNVVDVKEVKARKGIGTQKHLVVFRSNEIAIIGEDGDDVFPQILLTNSHDGKNCFSFSAGLFRMICENGLVISTQVFENVKIRHMGYTFEELEERIKEMVSRLPLTVETLNRMKEVQMEEKQIIEFAEKAINVRFGERKIKVNMEDFIVPVRIEDTKKDLWTVFNLVQEKLVSGDFDYLSEKAKLRKARPIKNFIQDQKLNIELFDLALEYAN